MEKDKVLAKETYAKLSSKQKINHLWEYYKWHAISALAIVAIIFSLAYGCATRVQPDLSIMYLAQREHFIPYETRDELAVFFAEHVYDVAGNENRVVFVDKLVFNTNPDEMDENDVMRFQAFQARISGGESKLFIVDAAFLERLQNHGIADIYAPITNPPHHIEGLPLYAVMSIEFARHLRPRHAERHAMERQNAYRIFELLTN